jgi:hypothetical protein
MGDGARLSNRDHTSGAAVDGLRPARFGLVDQEERGAANLVVATQHLVRDDGGLAPPGC